MLLAAETREGKHVNAPQPKACDDFSKLPWRSSIRNLLKDFSFQHLEPAILSTSHPFSPHRGYWCGMEIREETRDYKTEPFSSRGQGSHLAETLRARFLAGINHRGPRKSHTEVLPLYTH